MMFSQSQENRAKKICVVGAGAAALVSARELRREGHTVVVFEQNHDNGGQWLYDPYVEQDDPLGRNYNTCWKVHSSVYQSMRVNLPREILGFTDFPFLVKEGRDTRRYPGHGDILLYLQDSCDYFSLRQLISFNNRVEYVGMLDDCVSGEKLKWVVRSREKNSGKVIEEVFDAVVVANGHYAQPEIPLVKGMDIWKGKQMHSHVYRTPEIFRNEVVVLVGSGVSGRDISLQLIRVVKELHMSAKSLDVSEGFSKFISKHENFHLHPQIDCVHEDGRVTFLDGSCILADTILFCTGYSYSFPFLDTEGIVVVEAGRVGPLYEHVFPPSLAPSLSFVGIPKETITFPFFESQSKWIAQVLSEKTKLPSLTEMMASIEEFYNSLDIAGIPKQKTLAVHGGFELYNKYAEFSGSPGLEEWRKEICLSTLRNISVNLETFRDSWDDDDGRLLQLMLRSMHFGYLTRVMNLKAQAA